MSRHRWYAGFKEEPRAPRWAICGECQRPMEGETAMVSRSLSATGPVIKVLCSRDCVDAWELRFFEGRAGEAGR